ncbi:MAG: hypothetical protein M5R36_26030 [Deltaproteobacteria bacterium]|nr:hypothetical protein [Deltaproteobacteria bacterium]
MGPCAPGVVEKALEKIERLGLNAAPAAIEDAEIMYLQKQAYIQGIDNTPRFKKGARRDENKSKQEQVAALREFWNAELGVLDVTRLPHYGPFGEFQRATRGRIEGGGRRVQMRFDLTEADLDQQMGGFSLRHQLTDDRDMAEFIETALENNGAMVSTVEKIRMGIKPGGMSPVADMESGGGTYFFTRIRKTPTAGGPAARPSTSIKTCCAGWTRSLTITTSSGAAPATTSGNSENRGSTSGKASRSTTAATRRSSSIL